MSNSASHVAPHGRLYGKAVLVTGAAQGIGLGVARAVAAAGARVALLDKDFDRVIAAAKTIAEDALAVQCDVTDADQISQAVDSVQTAFGSLDGAVCNAGVVINCPAITMTKDQWDLVLGVNLTGVFLTAREVGRRMLRSGVGGSIVVTASMAARTIVRPQAQCAYNASKAGVVGLTKSLAVEWAQAGVRVNSVSPGYTRTDLVDSPALRPQHEEWAALTPMGRLGEVQDLIGAYVFLLSDESRFLTGHDLVIDGGYTLW